MSRLLPLRTGKEVIFYEVWKDGRKLRTYQSFSDAWKDKKALGPRASCIRTQSQPILSATEIGK